MQRGEKGLLIGSYEHTLDAKGRVFIPAKLREELGSELILVNGFEKCINVYSIDGWNEYSGKFTSVPSANKSVQKILRNLFASAVEREPDKQGRIILSNELKEYAEIESDVVIIGCMNKLEIWSKSVWEEYSEIKDEELDEEAMAVLAELGI